MRVFWLIALAACAKGGTGPVGDDGVDAPSNATCGEPGLLPCEAIHVAPTGVDTNNGKADSPMKTLTAALSRASVPNPPLAVFVQAGTYRESIAMKQGVDVYGGFGTDWKR